MKRKIVGILVMTLLIATAVLPAIGTMNENMNITTSNIQQPTVEWEKTYGGDEFDQFRCVQQTSDGGYIAYGEYEELDITYARLMKLDSEGEEEWTVINHNINGTGYDIGELMNSVIQTSDGGYLAGGYHMYHFVVDDYDFWNVCGFLWKVDSTGDTEWISHLYDVEGLAYMTPAYTIEIDNGFISTGWVIIFEDENLTEYTLEMVLFKTDLDGNLDWYESYNAGGGTWTVGQSICCTTDGGYYLTGTANQNDNVDVNGIYIVKTDANGNMQWDQIFDGPNSDMCYVRGCCQASDGGYIISGTTDSYGSGRWDVWVIKTDSLGNMDWNKTFGGTKNDHTWSMCKTNDGGYVLNIVTNLGGMTQPREDILLVKLDDDGNVEWKVQYEEEERQIPIFIDQTDDLGFIIAGRTGDPDRKSTDSFLLKISSFENQRPDKPTIDGPSKGKPDKEYTFTATASDPDGDSLTYMWDWGDGNFSEWLDDNEAAYTWTSEANFDVRVMTMDEHGGESDWSDPFEFSTPRNKALDLFASLIETLLARFPLLKLLIS